MTLSEKLTEALRMRFELPVAWAVRTVRRLADQPGELSWRKTWENAGQEKRR